ncbi:spore coat protein [Pseudoalteromonas sp. A25]|uniref:cytidylyltransferase domain-containing protein n=1 Tax=Pseudoalteromonas sp. A25 TaxID=116092 RepID=UPI001260DC4F|nr:glycosyltransferase family protein [Pseudoalteromonas sp. A25]BBN81097.1 spore coat protein [Pseudoalteromonas sp. A25]
MKVTAFIQARMSSTRLPGKVLKDILGKPMLLHIVERLRHAKTLSNIVVLTSDGSSDDAIATLCQNHSIHCFRGSLDDVLGRFFAASEKYPSDHIVRITADCPLVDSLLVDSIVTKHIQQNADYTSNCHPAMYPDGLDVEVMRTAALQQANNEATSPHQREHVTPYFLTHKTMFKCCNFDAPSKIPQYRLTVDHPEDFQLIKKIYETLYSVDNNFSLNSTLSLLAKHPNWLSVNEHFIRNEALQSNAAGDNEQ